MRKFDESVSRTGGREATTRRIPPKLALAVGMPATPPPKGWRWAALSEVARLESGHTPSRNHPEYWGGDVPWISIRDAKAHHGIRIHDTEEKVSRLGLENSSARLLPENTVCLSRTASVGYVVVMGRPMATSQDFVNWVCSSELEPEFLKYLFIAEGEDLLRFASGAVHQTIYFPEAKAFHVCFPSASEQRRIVKILHEAFASIAAAKAHAEQNRQNARALFESHLHAIFSQTPTSWPVQPLIALCDPARVLTYGVVQLGNEVPDGVPCLRTSNVRWLRIETGEVKHIAPAISVNYSRTVLCGGEVLVNVRGTLGGVAVVPKEMAGWNISREVAVAPVLPSKIDPHFLVYWIGSGVSQDWLSGMKKGAAYVGINIEDLRNLPVKVPPRAEQKQIVATLDALSAETRRLEALYAQKLAALDELKASLLHQAFSGQL